jgi:glyoxylase-like metal-dependent hydrolase (beta-lactamase superfamily II)
MPDTQQVALYVDAASHLISKYELIFVDAIAGEAASEILFGDYTTVDGHRFPRTFSQRLAGDVGSRFTLRTEMNLPLAADAFAAPAGNFRASQAVPLTLEAKVENLGDGAYALHNIAGQNQHSLAVEFRDHVLVVEAPGTSAGADRLIGRIRTLIPGKPIRYLAVTHHHGDHIGGLRSFVAEGAIIITTEANRPVIEAMAAARQNDRLGREPRTPEFLFVEQGRRTLSDGTQTVELIDVGPNPHAKEILIAWLPKQRVVFQGDLFILPNNDAAFGPPQPTLVSFARMLKELGLPAERFAGVHGPTGTREQFDRAVAGKL